MTQKVTAKNEVIDLTDHESDGEHALVSIKGGVKAMHGRAPEKRKRAVSDSDAPQHADVHDDSTPTAKTKGSSGTKQARQKATFAISSHAKKQIALAMIEEGRKNIKRDKLCQELDITTTQLSDQLRDRASINQTLLAAVDKL